MSIPVLGAEVLFVLFGHPPKRCKMRRGVITKVQDDLFIVQDPKYARPFAFDVDTKHNIPDAKRCTSCEHVIREGFECPCCGSEYLVAVNRLPSRYYVHKIILPAAPE